MSTTSRLTGLLRSAAVLGSAVWATWWLVPRITGTTWADVGRLMLAPSATQLTGLTLLWVVGLVLHSAVLTGSLPGLTARRALTLNLTGSAVANLLPSGGAGGVAANLMMMRRWSIPTVSFTAFTIVSNAWDVAAKLILPLLAAVLVTFGGHVVPPLLLTGVVIAAMIALVGLGLAAAGLRAAQRLSCPDDEKDDSDDDPAPSVPAPTVPRRMIGAFRDALPLARQTARAAWPRLTAGMSAYVASQAALLWACLRVLGCPAGVTTVVAAFAVERLTTLVPITPAGTGLAEAGALTVLVAMGCAPVPAAAGVLLYRLFTVVLEIPVGAVWLAGWSHVTRRARTA